MDSTGALELPEFPGGLLVIGGGIIGLEMACVYDALGRQGERRRAHPAAHARLRSDLVRPLERRIRARYEQILLGTKVARRRGPADGPAGQLRRARRRPSPQIYRPRAGRRRARRRTASAIGADAAGVTGRRARLHPGRQADAHQRPAHLRDRRHRRAADARAQGDARRQGGRRSRGGPQERLRCARHPLGRLHRSGDRLGGPHRDRGQGAGHRLQESRFPWVANGRSLSLGRDEGFTKLLFDPETHRLLGGGIVGTNAGELIARSRWRSKWARRRRYRPDDPSASDALGDRGGGGRGLRGHAHRFVSAEARRSLIHGARAALVGRPGGAERYRRRSASRYAVRPAYGRRAALPQRLLQQLIMRCSAAWLSPQRWPGADAAARYRVVDRWRVVRAAPGATTDAGMLARALR